MTCEVEGCERVVKTRGWCNMHYQRWLRHGSPLAPVKRAPGRPVLERLMGLVIKTGTGCWEWQGYRIRGYGTFHYGGPKMAHRVAYELLVGPIPEGLQLDHLCRNPPCVNPAHLEPVTPRENVLRSNARHAVAVRLNQCAAGHPFTPESTRWDRRRNGRTTRACSICANAHRRKRRAAKKAAGLPRELWS